MQWKEANKIAVGICYLLQPYCEPERIRIAGSIRRKKAEVKDIEICCLPKKTQPQKFDLFGGVEQLKPQINKEFERRVNNLGTIEAGKPDGRYMKIMLPQGIKLDLFMPDPPDFYRQFAIRTGSAEYAARVIATGWTKRGWCGTEKGLRKMSDCEKKEYTDPAGKAHTTWKIKNEDGERTPVWESEEHFFEWLGVEFIPPHSRFFT